MEHFVMAHRSPHFRCWFTNDETQQCINTSVTSAFAFQSEEGKKASFLLSSTPTTGSNNNNDDSLTPKLGCEPPAHVCIDAVLSDDENNRKVSFVLGGFEIVSNSRNLEVYLSDENDKEAYLTTCRAIKWRPDSNANQQPQHEHEHEHEHEQHQEKALDSVESSENMWYRALLVIPGGPRTMTRIRLKMLSIQPPPSTKSLVQYIKLKGRLPQIELTHPEPIPQPIHRSSRDSTSTAELQTPQSTQLPPQQLQQQGLSTSDIAAALAGVSMMVHGVEERLTSSFESSHFQLNQGLSNRLHRLEHVIQMQSTTIQQLQLQLQQQNTMILQQQAQLLNQMHEQQSVCTLTFEQMGRLRSSIVATHTDAVETSENEHSTLSSQLYPTPKQDTTDFEMHPTGLAYVGDGISSQTELPLRDKEDHITCKTSISDGRNVVSATFVDDDDDCKPPLRARSHGAMEALLVSSQSTETTETNQAEKIVHDAIDIANGQKNVIHDEAEESAECFSSLEKSGCDIDAVEDGDNEPPSRAWVDEDRVVQPLCACSHMLENFEPTILTQPIRPHGETSILTTEKALVGDDANDNDHLREESGELCLGLLSVVHAGLTDSDSPPSRPGYTEDDISKRVVTVLEPPDKGNPADSEIDTEIVLVQEKETDLIDLS